MGKWVSFKLEEPRRRELKTDVWHVWNLSESAHLGTVKWYGPWRKYAFFPAAETLYEQDCLRDIAAFVESETLQHRKGKRAFPPEVTA
jgi:hypothetical protein